MAEDFQMICMVGVLPKLFTIDDVTKYCGILVSWHFLRRMLSLGIF